MTTAKPSKKEDMTTPTVSGVETSPQPVPVPVLTESDKIWEGIKNLPLDLYSLPGQTVSTHTKRFIGSPDAVYLKLSSSAVVASLEVALGKKYTTEVSEAGYILVKNASPSVAVPKEAAAFGFPNSSNYKK